MKYYIRQNNELDCGITSVKILSSILHKDEEYLFDLENQRLSSMMDLKKELKKRNIEAEGFYIDDFNELKKIRNAIILIKENTLNHFVILKKITKKFVHLIDPKLGKRIIDINYFKTIFTKNALVVQKVNKKKKINKDHYFMYKISYFISFLIDFSLIYVLTYIINIEGQILYTSLVIVSILLNLAFKFFIALSFSASIEKKMIMPLFKFKMDIDELKICQEYKVKMIEDSFKNRAYIYIAFFTAIILIKNSVYNLISIFACFIYLYGYFKVGEYKTIIESDVYNHLESDLKIEKSQYLKIKKKSSFYLFISIGLKIILVIISLFVSAFINYINNYSSFIFLSVNFFMCLTLNKLITSVYENDYVFREKFNETKYNFLKIIKRYKDGNS